MVSLDYRFGPEVESYFFSAVEYASSFGNTSTSNERTIIKTSSVDMVSTTAVKRLLSRFLKHQQVMCLMSLLAALTPVCIPPQKMTETTKCSSYGPVCSPGPTYKVAPLARERVSCPVPQDLSAVRFPLSDNMRLECSSTIAQLLCRLGPPVVGHRAAPSFRGLLRRLGTPVV